MVNRRAGFQQHGHDRRGAAPGRQNQAVEAGIAGMVGTRSGLQQRLQQLGLDAQEYAQDSGLALEAGRVGTPCRCGSATWTDAVSDPLA